MRQTRIRVGIVLLVVASGLTALWWDTVIDLGTRHRKYNMIEKGMTQMQVEGIIGEKGAPQLLRIAGEENEDGLPSLFQWRDGYTKLDVVFSGSRRSPGIATIVYQAESDLIDHIVLWCQRVLLILLWAFGIGILVRGLRKPMPAGALNSPPTSDTKDGAHSPAE